MNANENGRREKEPIRTVRSPDCLPAENLSAELDGEYHFSPEEQRHLEHCPRCRDLYESFRVLDDAVTRSLMVKCPADAAYRIRKNVNRRLDRLAPMNTHRPIRFTAFAARVAAAVILAAMAGYLIFIDNPYSDELRDAADPAPISTAAVKRTEPQKPELQAPLFPNGVDIRNLRLAAAGEGTAFRFTEPAAVPVKAEHAALIPDAVKHIWLFDPAWKNGQTEKTFRSALERAGIPLDQVRITPASKRGFRVNLQLTRRQTVLLTRLLNAAKLQLVSPVQPQPEQRLFAGTGEETVEYEAVLLPRG